MLYSHPSQQFIILNLLEMVAGLVIAPYAKFSSIRTCADTYFCAKVLIIIPPFPILAVTTCKNGFVLSDIPSELFNNTLMR